MIEVAALALFSEDDKKSAKPGRDERGLFQHGNQIWEKNPFNGVPKLYGTPELLLESCIEYLNWCVENPWFEEKVFGTGERMDVSKARYPTQYGLCAHLNMAVRTWREYRDRPGFQDVCEYVENVMTERKMSGAAAGMFNASIVARELGLADKHEHTGKDGEPLMSQMTEEQQMEKLQQQIPFITPLLRKMGYEITKTEEESEDD